MINILCDDKRVSMSLLRETAMLFENDIKEDITVYIELDSGIVQARGAGLCQRVMLTAPTASAKLAAYHLLSRYSGVKKPWGALTGVKPLKPMIKLLEAGYTREDANALLTLEYAISPDKLGLMWETASYQSRRLYPAENTYALYVHIPFCISKCTYCSFPSDITSEGSDLCDAYLNALVKELNYIKEINSDKICDNIYIGGGTPSILSLAQNEKLFAALEPFAQTATELTYEAGRCDTLGGEKLSLIKQLGASRISLNPQTVCDKTLKLIKRPVTHRDFLKCYESACAAGWDDINTDLIFGLPEENEADFIESLSLMKALAPSSITLHSLCKKRTSEMTTEEAVSTAINIPLFLDMARGSLKLSGYSPYYLYRQKSAAGSAENTGYCRDGKVCVYNIRMMGDTQSIYSAGANSSTKLCFVPGERFVNIYNVKNTDLYIKNIDAVIAKKNESIKKSMQSF